MRVDGAEIEAFEETFDYVVVGSGAAGATAARALAETGRSVCVLEEGRTTSPRTSATTPGRRSRRCSAT
ncbi:MAG: FAD-dependent oxidoreductase [Elusimicrobiota bacterium]|nr:MAG: FAD-dependent oxidoreductase [Elusimicrobiota bacterium]